MSKCMEVLRGYVVGSCVPVVLLHFVGVDEAVTLTLVGTQIVALAALGVIARRQGYKFLGGL